MARFTIGGCAQLVIDEPNPICSTCRRDGRGGPVKEAEETMGMWKRVSALWLLVRGDARCLWFALRHPQAPLWLKGGTAMVVLYLVSPVDLIPDVIPFLGVMDDLVLVPAAIRLMLRYLPEQVRADVERRASGQRPTQAG